MQPLMLDSGASAAGRPLTFQSWRPMPVDCSVPWVWMDGCQQLAITWEHRDRRPLDGRPRLETGRVRTAPGVDYVIVQVRVIVVLVPLVVRA